jgi:hypothetical protein
MYNALYMYVRCIYIYVYIYIYINIFFKEAYVCVYRHTNVINKILKYKHTYVYMKFAPHQGILKRRGGYCPGS